MQLDLFLSEVRSQTTLPLLKQYLLLYSSIDIQVRGERSFNACVSLNVSDLRLSFMF